MTIQMQLPFQNRVHRSSPTRLVHAMSALYACAKTRMRLAAPQPPPGPVHAHHPPPPPLAPQYSACAHGWRLRRLVAAAMKSSPEIGPGRLKETLEDDCSSLFDKKAAASKYFFYVGFGRGIFRNLRAVSCTERMRNYTRAGCIWSVRRTGSNPHSFLRSPNATYVFGAYFVPCTRTAELPREDGTDRPVVAHASLQTAG